MAAWDWSTCPAHVWFGAVGGWHARARPGSLGRTTAGRAAAGGLPPGVAPPAARLAERRSIRFASRRGVRWTVPRWHPAGWRPGGPVALPGRRMRFAGWRRPRPQHCNAGQGRHATAAPQSQTAALSGSSCRAPRPTRRRRPAPEGRDDRAPDSRRPGPRPARRRTCAASRPRCPCQTGQVGLKTGCGYSGRVPERLQSTHRGISPVPSSLLECNQTSSGRTSTRQSSDKVAAQKSRLTPRAIERFARAARGCIRLQSWMHLLAL